MVQITYEMPLDQLIMMIRVVNEIHWNRAKHTIDFEMMTDNQYS